MMDFPPCQTIAVCSIYIHSPGQGLQMVVWWVEASENNSGDLKANTIIAVRIWCLIWVTAILFVCKGDKGERRHTRWFI